MTSPTPGEGLSLVHLVRPAQGARPAGEKAPLLVLAHGVGSNERDLFSFADELDPRFVVVSARAPLTRGPGSYAWFETAPTPQGFRIEAAELDASRQIYAAFVAAAARAYDADPARIYTLGFSQGAILSLVTALSHPGLFTGVVAMSGRIPPEAEPWLASPEQTAGLPVFMAHGTRDGVISIDHARSARDLLERQRVDLTYREYPAPHAITPAMFSDMTGWMSERLNSTGPA